MKRISTVLISTAIIGAFSGNVSAHPLEGAIQNLSKTAVELDLTANKNPELAQSVAKLKARTESLWSDAILIPIRTSDAALSALGYDFASNASHIYDLAGNANLAAVEQNTYDFKPANWQAIIQIVDREAGDLKRIYAMRTDPAFSSGISLNRNDAVGGEASLTRMDVIDGLRERAQDSLTCIDYFSKAYLKYGLRPVGTSVVNWSVEDLSRVYGVRDFASIPAAQKIKVRDALVEMMDNLNATESLCIPPAQAAFLEAARNQAIKP